MTTSGVKIRWSEQAVEDLTEIHRYIARNSPRYAAAVAGRVVDAVDRLQAFPDIGRMVPELGDPTVREVIEGAYRIIYERRAEAVEILTVFRGTRAFPRIER